MLALSILACCWPSGPSETVLEPIQIEPEPPPAPEDRRYAVALLLDLRDGPAPEAQVTDCLAPGTAVSLLAQRDGAAHVRTADGREGWLPAEALTPEPPSADALLARAGRASDPAEALAWTRLAAEISPDPDTLTALSEALVAAGDAEGAAQAARRAHWPAEIALAHGELSGPWLPWRRTDEPLPEGPLDEAALARLGLVPGEPWWILPARGPAVQATLVGAVADPPSACAPARLVRIELASRLPNGTAVAFTRSMPPAAWAVDRVPPTDSDRLDALAAAEAAAAELGAIELHAIRLESGWLIRTLHADPSSDPGLTRFRWIDHQVVGRVATELGRGEATSEAAPAVPFLARDLDGDGTLEVLWSDRCATAAVAPDGTLLARSAPACCGC